MYKGFYTQAGDEPGVNQIYPGEGVVMSYVPPWCWRRINPVFFVSVVVSDILGECGQGGGWRGMIPEMRRRTCGCCVHSLFIAECRTLQVTSPLADNMRELPRHIVKPHVKSIKSEYC